MSNGFFIFPLVILRLHQSLRKFKKLRFIFRQNYDYLQQVDIWNLNICSRELSCRQKWFFYNLSKISRWRILWNLILSAARLLWKNGFAVSLKTSSKNDGIKTAFHCVIAFFWIGFWFRQVWNFLLIKFLLPFCIEAFLSR